MSEHPPRHRGPFPQDHRDFAPDALPVLRLAVAHVSWMLSRGYSAEACLRLVGDHHQLRDRQRLAVRRSACGDASLTQRQALRVPGEALAGRPLFIDGFNLLIALESALSGGILLHGRDGCWRDLSSVHGSYRSVEETVPALMLVGELLQTWAPSQVIWLLDRPISNSGRLAARILELATEQGWPWEVNLEFSPDSVLKACGERVVTTDGVILDHCAGWLNLVDALLEARLPNAWRFELGGETP